MKEHLRVLVSMFAGCAGLTAVGLGTYALLPKEESESTNTDAQARYKSLADRLQADVNRTTLLNTNVHEGTPQQDEGAPSPQDLPLASLSPQHSPENSSETAASDADDVDLKAIVSINAEDTELLKALHFLRSLIDVSSPAWDYYLLSLKSLRLLITAHHVIVETGRLKDNIPATIALALNANDNALKYIDMTLKELKLAHHDHRHAVFQISMLTRCMGTYVANLKTYMAKMCRATLPT